MSVAPQLKRPSCDVQSELVMELPDGFLDIIDFVI